MDIREFKSALKPYRALIGFDYGAKRLGVAVSDLLLTVATSHKIIQRGSWEKDLAEISQILSEKEIGGMVFGLPLQMNGGISMPIFFLTIITLIVSLWRSAKSSTQHGTAKGDPLAATGMLPRLTLFYHWKNWWKVTAPRYLPLNVRKKPSSVPL